MFSGAVVVQKGGIKTSLSRCHGKKKKTKSWFGRSKHKCEPGDEQRKGKSTALCASRGEVFGEEKVRLSGSKKGGCVFWVPTHGGKKKKKTKLLMRQKTGKGYVVGVIKSLKGKGGPAP